MIKEGGMEACKRRCSHCSKEFPITLEFFYKKLNGLTTRCKKCTKKFNNQNYKKHRRAYLEQKKEYWNTNKESIKEYREVNKNRDNATRRVRLKRKRKEDPLFNLQKRISGGIRRGFKHVGESKGKYTKKILGCDYKLLREYLIRNFECLYRVKYEDRFWPRLEIDHVIPISTASTIEEVEKLNHYTNLQLLYCKDNGNKYNYTNWKFKPENSLFYEEFGLQIKEHDNEVQM